VAASQFSGRVAPRVRHAPGELVWGDLRRLMRAACLRMGQLVSLESCDAVRLAGLGKRAISQVTGTTDAGLCRATVVVVTMLVLTGSLLSACQLDPPPNRPPPAPTPSPGPDREPERPVKPQADPDR
jgi:hypothetical protein